MIPRADGPRCQSCGMPLARDPQGGGTEVDGRRSTEYCSHCYQKGAFTDPRMTAERMVENVRSRLQQMKLPPDAVDQLTREIPTLRRWAG
jgi:hypothetical protein